MDGKVLQRFKELGTEIINFEEKAIKPLTNKEIKKQKVCHICKEKFCNGKSKKKKLVIIAITPGNSDELLIVNVI